MARVEEEGLKTWKDGAGTEIDWWNRFRDDCLGLWRGSREEFLSFVTTMNQVDKDIKFTSEINWTENKVVFLDLTISINEAGYLETDLYTKPNAKNALLLPSSAHRPSTTKSSVYSLALRINRICSTAKAADQRYIELAERLREREYKEKDIENGVNRAKAIKREDALRKVDKKESEGGRQHRLVTEFDRRTSQALGGILTANYDQMAVRDQRLRKIFPKPPKPAYTRGRNIKEMLCRARLPPDVKVTTRSRAELARNGVSRCNRGLARQGCMACPYITSRPSEVVKTVTIHSTGQVLEVEGKLNCKTREGYLYLLWSSKAPAKQYIGSSDRQPSVRLGEHRRDIENGKVEKAVPKHFQDTRSTAADLVFVPFKRIKAGDRHTLKHFENKAINDFNMIAAGINRVLA